MFSLSCGLAAVSCSAVAITSVFHVSLLYAHAPGGLTSRVPTAWSQFIRKAVLGVILARAGLSMVRTGLLVTCSHPQLPFVLLLITTTIV